MSVLLDKWSRVVAGNPKQSRTCQKKTTGSFKKQYFAFETVEYERHARQSSEYKLRTSRRARHMVEQTFLAVISNTFSRVYQPNSNSRPNSRPQSPAMGVRETLDLGSPRRQLSRRSRSSSLDSFSEELLGLSGGSLEYQNELCPDRQCIYSPKGNATKIYQRRIEK